MKIEMRQEQPSRGSFMALSHLNLITGGLLFFLIAGNRMSPTPSTFFTRRPFLSPFGLSIKNTGRLKNVLGVGDMRLPAIRKKRSPVYAGLR